MFSYSFLLALWVRTASDESSDSSSGAAAVRWLGTQLKTFVLAYGKDEQVNQGNVDTARRFNGIRREGARKP
jgi:hypothetical protein